MKRRTRRLLLALFLLLSFFGAASGETEKRRAEPAKPAPTSKEMDKKKAEPPKPITITADRMEANRKLHVVNYLDNVIVRKDDFTIYARRMEFLFDEKMEEIQKITAEGDVRMVDPEKTATADKAVYLNDQDVLILTGNPKIWQGDNVIVGSKMTLLRKEDRSIVEGDGKERVISIFYPSKEGEGSKGGMLPKSKANQEKSSRSKGN